MKTVDDFREFYERELAGDLRVLDGKRQRVMKNLIIVFAVAGGIGLTVGLALLGASGGNPVVFLLPMAGCLVVGGVVGSFMSKGYRSEFKLTVIDRIVRFVDERLRYSPREYIDKHTFMESKIFTTRPNRYKGDDLVAGRVGDTDVRFCELNAVHESGSGKNKRRTTVFRGLFFIADFHKHFRTETVVLPDTAEKLFGRFGQKLQSLNFFRGELIKLEDPEFEQNFAVYGADQVEARYILSTSLMRRILDFKRKTGRRIHLSFVASKVFVAISYSRKLFEPRVFRTLLDFGPMQEYFEDLTLAVGIVEDLNLNTRIWSKK